MDLEEAKKFLKGCKRMELRDHAFGDREVFWTFEDVDTATGYFSCSTAYVTFKDGNKFEDDDAHELESCGTLDEVWRNDKTGPEIFIAGVTMPGLTTEGVLKELTGEHG